MSIPPPGLGGGVTRTGPPPGLGGVSLPRSGPPPGFSVGVTASAPASHSPALNLLQSLQALQPGGPPRSSGSIPLEDVLFELGENLTQDESTIEGLVRRWWSPWLFEGSPEETRQKITEETCCVMRGLCDGLSLGRAVDLHGIIKGMSAIDGISWPDVVRSFDVPMTPAAYPSSIPLLVSLICLPSQVPVPPMAGLLPANLDSPIWENISSLLSVLNHLTNLPPDAMPIFTMTDAPPPSSYARIVDTPTSEQVWSKQARQQARDLQGAGLWNTLGLVQVLVHACALAEMDHRSEREREERADIGRRATEILEKAAKLAPELILIAMEKLAKPLPSPVVIQQTRLLAMYLSTKPTDITSSALVFHMMWEINPNNLMSVLLEFYGEDENNLGRIFEIGAELKILGKILAVEDNVHFVLDVATLASNKEVLNLEKWLADGIEIKGEEFLEAIFDFVEHKIRLEFEHQHQPQSENSPLLYTLGPTVYSIFIRVVRNAPDLSRENIARFKNLRTDILILHPRLLNLRPNSKQEQGFAEAKFSKEVVDKVDDLYQRMYAGQLKLDAVVDELKKCQKSNESKDRDIFAHALHSLFDEYKFVKSYPIKELTMTGILFGAIIDYRLIKDTPAFVATRYVLDACKTSPHEPLYQFGINALSVLRNSLVDFPGLCRSLLEIPALHESHPVLINDIQQALIEREELDLQGGVKLAFPALKLPVLIEEGDDEFQEPETGRKDTIMFHVNQIAPTNYEEKAKALLEVFENRHSRWFAHYFIDVRVSLEQNRHEIYMQLLQKLNSPLLDRHILWETYRKARELLNSEATINSASERAILKTMAMWLGRITLAQNKPVRMKELSVKDLLIQGYDTKRLIVAIPFVCNLVASCKDSAVFHPPNPWLTAILRLLAEFYHFGELRLNMKFEIEVLFSKLGVELASFEPSNLLRMHVPPPLPQSEVADRLDLELQRATSEMMNGAQRMTDLPGNEAYARIQQLQTEAAVQAAQDQLARRVDELIAQLPEYLVFNQDYPIFTAPTLKRIVHHSIDRAVRDIITPVIERSVTIAGISSRDLIQKDFGTEPDALRMRQAAHMMVQNLAGSLALVTCKEPLRSSMIANVKSMLEQNGYTDDTMPDAMIAGVVNQNLDVACSVLKKAAMEKAAKDIDVNLAPQYAARKAHQNSRSAVPFWDGASFGVAISHSALPDPLKLRPGGLTAQQFRVYEDFGEPARVMSTHPANTANGDYLAANYQNLVINDTLEMKAVPSPRHVFSQDVIGSGVEATASPHTISPQISIDRFHELAAEIQKAIIQTPASSITALPAEHELRGLIKATIIVANQSVHRENTTLAIAQKVVQLLYRSTTQLGREVYVYLLQQLCDLSAKVNREVKQWLIYAEDVRKLNVSVTVTLLRAQSIGVQELDIALSHIALRSYPPEVLDFITQLIRQCSVSDQAWLPRQAFSHSLASLLKAQETSHATPLVDALLDELRGPREPSASVDGDQSKTVIDGKLQERLAHYFLEWVRVFSGSKNPEVSFVPYVTYLQKEGILSGEDVSSAFYRTAIYTAVDLDTAKLNPEEPSKFYGVDALAKLIVLIVKNYGDKNGTSSSVGRAVYYYNKIITIMSYSLVQRQLAMGDAFNQRPWARFFTSMLSELSTIEYSLPETYLGCLKHLANNLGITQPTYAPRFAFGWISIISHRLFMPKLLQSQRDEGWPEYHRCVMWLLRFLAPFLQSDEMTPSSRSIFKATLRILMLLLHDFPEFLVEFYHTLSTVIPPHCTQMRNVVLAAFPQSEAPLPDCYKRLDQLVPEMQRFPTVRSDYIGALADGNVKAAIDQYVRTGVPALSAIVTELKNRIAVKSMGPGNNTVITWNHTLLHASIFYLGTTAVARGYQQTGIAEFNAKEPEVAILVNLAHAFDAEGSYYMLNVIADQLRYPSAHTLFFIHFMLFLFRASTQDDVSSAVPERIARILLERTIVKRPHPWGLLVAFIELLDNELYGFWKQPFIRVHDEIYRLFGQVRQSAAAERESQ
nr:CCR4-NOT transcription complex subunit 1 [Cryptococcus depauperatus CBS 7841]